MADSRVIVTFVLSRPIQRDRLKPNLLASEDDRRRFVHEAQASAALSHPNIATVFEINESEAKTAIMLAALIVALLAIYLFYPYSPTIPTNRKSIAVIPFQNFSDSKEGEYFIDFRRRSTG